MGLTARTAPGMWASVELRRRWRALVTLGLLVGVTVGLATAAVAGARRTASAWERLREMTNASDAIVFTSQAGLYRNEELGYDAFAELPYVQGAGAFGLAYGQQGAVFMSTYGDWLQGTDKPRIVKGRAPDPHDPTEMVVSNPEAGASDGLPELDVGDRLTISFLTPQQQSAGRYDPPEGPTVTFRIVGIGDSPFEMAAIPGGGLFVGPAFRQHHGDGIALFSNLMVRLQDPVGDVPRLEEEVARRYPGRGVPVYDLAAASKRVTNGTDLERSGLLLFAGAVAVAGMVIVGQALTRSVRSAGADVPVLVAVGFTRRDVARALALPYVLSVAVAVVTAVALAIALSPRFPIGLGRRVDPDVGLHLDLPVVAAGALAVAMVLVAAVVAAAWRSAANTEELAGTRRSAIVSVLAGMGAPVSVVTGASLALERGSGRRALPTRPACAGTVVGVLGVIGALTLAAGIGDAVEHPERFGSAWDLEVNFPGEEPDEAFRAAPASLAANPDVSDVARVARLPLSIGETVLPVYALDAVTGSIEFVLLDGRRPERRGDIVLGPDSAKALGVEIGDRLPLGEDEPFNVVGIGLLPTTPHSSFDQGGWVRGEDLVRAIPSAQKQTLIDQMGLPEPPGDEELSSLVFDMAFVAARFAEGVDVAAAARRAMEAGGRSLMIERPREPADQQNLRNVRRLPLLFGAFSVALAMGALAHVSVSVLRRRLNELAVLRSLGCTPGQVRACLSWQALVVASLGLVVGVPVGVAVGRSAWRLVTDATPMVYQEPLAVTALALVAPLALALADLVAVWPGRRASRMRPAEVLRTE